MKYLGQRRRAQVGLYTVIILNIGVYIWSIIMQTRFKRHDPGKIDWDDGLYPSSFLPYFFVQTTGPLSQSYMYWLLSSFATDAQGEYSISVIKLWGGWWVANGHAENVRNGAAFRCIEAIGQAVAYGMNTQTESDPLTGLYVLPFPHHPYIPCQNLINFFNSCVTFALLGAAILPMIMLVNSTPERIPADVIAEQQNAASRKDDEA